MSDQDPRVAWGPAIPLDPVRAEVLLQTIALRDTAAELVQARRLATARDATIAVLRLDTAAARAPRTRGALSAFRWPPRPAGDSRLAWIDRLGGSGLFLAGWYGEHHASAIDGGDPWAHFLAVGLDGGLAPNPFFDPRWYAETHLGGRHDGPAILHYVRTGARYALAPGPLFDAAAYLAADPALAAEPDALAHFLTLGIDAGREAIPVA